MLNQSAIQAGLSFARPKGDSLKIPQHTNLGNLSDATTKPLGTTLRHLVFPPFPSIINREHIHAQMTKSF